MSKSVIVVDGSNLPTRHDRARMTVSPIVEYPPGEGRPEKQ